MLFHGDRVTIVGILNTTPDSFSDGGEAYGAEAGVEAGLRLVEEGADILDIGGIDALLNNAGYGAYGALEATPMEVIQRQFDVNLFGLIAVTKAVLPPVAVRDAAAVDLNVANRTSATVPAGGLAYDELHCSR